MQFRFHTKALLYNPEGKILVQQRSDTSNRDLPWGQTELPEKIEEAILREIQEETGINSVENLKILHIESQFTPEQDRYFVLCIFKWELKEDPLISAEHQAYKLDRQKNQSVCR